MNAVDQPSPSAASEAHASALRGAFAAHRPVDGWTRAIDARRQCKRARAFTLAELLVVIGIIAVLAVLTSVSVQRIAKDARLAGASNAVIAQLGTARAIAIRDNATVIVTFKPSFAEPPIYGPSGNLISPGNAQKGQVTEVLIGKSSGRYIPLDTSTFDVFGEQFLPVPGVPSRRLARGIRVAAPGDYESAFVPRWSVLPEYLNQEVGRSFCVCFGPDGSLRTRNPALPGSVQAAFGGNADNTSTFIGPWLDADGDGQALPGAGGNQNIGTWVTFRDPSEEPLLGYTTLLAVYDYEDAADRADVTEWQASGSAISEPTAFRQFFDAYVPQFGDFIGFNRWTGVARTVDQ